MKLSSNTQFSCFYVLNKYYKAIMRQYISTTIVLFDLYRGLLIVSLVNMILSILNLLMYQFIRNY